MATRDLADVTGSTTGQGTYAVDRFGGGVAYVPEPGAPGAMRAVGSGVPTSALSAIESCPETSLDLESATDAGWDGSWQLSKPAAPGARVVVKHTNGRVVRTLDAVQHGAALTASWDGRDEDGAFAKNDSYVWELTAGPQDGQGQDLELSGTITVTGAHTGAAPGASRGRASDGGEETVYAPELLAARRETTA